MSERTIIGHEPCRDCGSQVEQRVNQGGKVYTRCDGTLGPGCGGQHTYGPGKSRAMIAAIADPAPAPKPVAAPAPKPVQKAAPVQAPKPVAAPVAPAAKPGSGWGASW